MMEEKLSFQQWLLSERTLKMILYSGAFLLVLAGIVFVQTQWAMLQAWQKVSVTMGMTVLTYGSGVLLARRSSSLRVGALALLGVAAGFAPLNFVLLDMLDVIPPTIDPRWTWLLGSLVCAAVYGWTVHRVRAGLLTLFTALAGLSAYAAVIAFFTPPIAVWMLLLCLPPFLLSALSRRWQHHAWLGRPLHTLAHIATPLLWLGSTTLWVNGTINALDELLILQTFDPWTLLAVTGISAAFYWTTDWLNSRAWERWLSVSMVTGTFLMSVFQFALPFFWTALILLLLGVGYWTLAWKFDNQESDDQTKRVFPLYVAGYVLIALVNLLAWMTYSAPQIDIALLLFADALICLLVAFMHKREIPVYLAMGLFLAAVWMLALVPKTLFWSQPPFVFVGLFVGILYFVIGRRLRHTRPTTSHLPRAFMVSGLLLIAAGLATAVDWLSVLQWMIETAAAIWRPLYDGLITFVSNKVVQSIGLQIGAAVFYLYTWQNRHRSYALSFTICIGLLLSFAGVLVAFPFESVRALQSLLLVWGIAHVVIGLLMRGDFGRHSRIPFLIFGWLIMLLGIGFNGVALVFIGLPLLLIGIQKRQPRMSEVGGAVILAGLLVIVYEIGWLLHIQMLIVPIGLYMLAVGWYEKQRGNMTIYRWLTWGALLIMFSTSFLETYNGRIALLFIVEGVAAVAWGIFTQSRNFVRLGVTALILFGMWQFYVHAAGTPRFVQIGGIGLTLLGGGLCLLFYRERLLAYHAAWQTTWKAWNP